MVAKNTPAALQPTDAPVISPPTFTKIEKNLAFLGFFSPSSKHSKKHKSKRVVFDRTTDGKRVEVSATIIPGAVYGLPLTADQDKFLALQKIINDVQRRDGEVKNPVSFSSADILRLTKHKKNGDRYKEIKEWLFLMDSVQILSEGVVWLSGKKKWAQESLRLFSRVVAVGEELDSGKIADKYYVWLSDWMLANIRNTYLLPVDLDTYHRLRTSLAKVLVPLLQIRLYASRKAGRFEIRYHKLSQILGVTRCRYLADIKKQLIPSLNELTAHGYLAGWQILPTQNRSDYKLVFLHGKKFLQDLQLVEGPPSDSSDPPPPVLVGPAADSSTTGSGADPRLIKELELRGIAAADAAQLLSKTAPDQDVSRQIEFVDRLIKRAPKDKFWNAPGLYLHYIKANIQPPATFRSRKVRHTDGQKHPDQDTPQASEQAVLLAYIYSYKPAETEKYIHSHPKEFRDLVQQEAQARGIDESVASRNVRRTLAGLAEGNSRFPLLSFLEFRNRWNASKEFRLCYPVPQTA